LPGSLAASRLVICTVAGLWRMKARGQLSGKTLGGRKSVHCSGTGFKTKLLSSHHFGNG